jgi:hypothetical protein
VKVLERVRARRAVTVTHTPVKARVVGFPAVCRIDGELWPCYTAAEGAGLADLWRIREFFRAAGRGA